MAFSLFRECKYETSFSLSTTKKIVNSLKKQRSKVVTSIIHVWPFDEKKEGNGLFVKDNERKRRGEQTTRTRYGNYLTGFNEVGHRWLAERKSNSRRSLTIMIASHAARLKQSYVRSYVRSYIQYEAVKISSAFRARARPRNTTSTANKNVGRIADTIQHEDTRN